MESFEKITTVWEKLVSKKKFIRSLTDFDTFSTEYDKYIRFEDGKMELQEEFLGDEFLEKDFQITSSEEETDETDTEEALIVVDYYELLCKILSEIGNRLNEFIKLRNAQAISTMTESQTNSIENWAEAFAATAVESDIERHIPKIEKFIKSHLMDIAAYAESAMDEPELDLQQE